MQSSGPLLVLACLFFHAEHSVAEPPSAAQPSHGPSLLDSSVGVSLLQVSVQVAPGPCKLCRKGAPANRTAGLSELDASRQGAARGERSPLGDANGSRAVALAASAGPSAAPGATEPVIISASVPQVSLPTLEGLVDAVEERVTGPASSRPRRGVSVGSWIAIGVGAFLLLVLIPLLAIAGWLFSKKSIRRVAHFWWHAYPIYKAYVRALKALPEGTSEKEVDKALDPLHEYYAPKVLDLILEMGGLFVKAAQASAAMPHRLPKPYRAELAKCSSQCRAMTPEEVRAAVEAELASSRGARSLCGLCGDGDGAATIETAFSSFEERPIGAASIGQVHRATLHDGRQIVIKVQRPGVREVFQADISCLATMAKWAQTDGVNDWGVMLVEELEKQMQQEFDYLQEASNTEMMREILLPRFADRVELPEVLWELTTDRMLAMTFLEGEGLDRAFADRLAASGVDPSAIMRAMGSEEMQEAKPESKAEGENDASAAARQAAPAEPGSGDLRPKDGKVDFKRVMDTLLDIYGFCILVRGIYNADPHPGNVLLMPDGRLGLIDFGQVKLMNEESRVSLTYVVTGIVDGDQARTVQGMNTIGFQYKSSDDSVGHEDICWHQALWLFGKMAVIPFPDSIKTTEVHSDNSRDMPLVVRTITILKGVALAFGVWISPAEAWLPWAAASPEEEERLQAVLKALQGRNLSGTWAMTSQATGEDVHWVFKHPPGQQFFFATQQGDGAQGHPNGHVRGRSIEWKCGSSGRLWRGSLDNDGEHLSQIQCFAPSQKFLGAHRGVLASGRVVRAVNRAQGVSSTLCFAFKSARLARKKKTKP